MIDGLVNSLRNINRPNDYAGIELEVNQKYAAGTRRERMRLRETIIRGVRDVLCG